MDNNDNKQPQGLKLDLKPEVAKGSYSNLAIITHSHSEFIIDFATMLPRLSKPEIGNRIIMTQAPAERAAGEHRPLRGHVRSHFAGRCAGAEGHIQSR